MPVLEGSICNGRIRCQFDDEVRNTIEMLRWMRAATGQGIIDELLGAREDRKI
jgi:hypothetical protein